MESDPNVLVLAHHYDAEASWLQRSLVEEHGQPALLLWPEALGVDYRISMRLRNDGRHAIGIEFLDGRRRRYDTRSFGYVVNRLGYIEPLVWEHSVESEKAYAAAEINAFFSAFVRALPTAVSNPVRNGALWSGASFESRWAYRLSRDGVAVHPLAHGDATAALAALQRADPAVLRRWLHFEGKLYAPVGQPRSCPANERAILREGPDELLEFVALADTPDDEPRLLWSTRTPALSCYGQPFVRALATRLAP